MSPPSLLRLLLPLLVFLLGTSALLAAPQRRSTFDPQEDLPGYLEAFLGDYGDLYDFAPYQAEKGKRLDAGRLTELRRLWTEEQARVRERIAVIEQDPRAAWLYGVDRRLKRSRFFQETELVRIDTYAPYYFYVERPFRRQDEFEERFVGLLGPAVQKIAELFRAVYVEPEGLTLNPKFPALGVVVLGSKGRYSDYAEATQNRSLYWSEAHYDPSLRLAVTYRGDGGFTKAADTIRRALLHEFVHALQHAYSAGELLQETWLAEGMAEYLSYMVASPAPALEQRLADKKAVEDLTPVTEPNVREVLLPGLLELAGSRSYGEVVSNARRRMQRVRVALPDTLVLALHYAQSGLLVHFLHHAEGGKHAPALRRYVALALRNASGPDALKEAFAGQNIAELDQAFQRYVRDLYRGYFPDRPLEKLPEVGATPQAAEASAPRAEPNFRPEDLRADPRTGEDRLALAVARAEQGAMAAAAADLRAWQASAAANDPARERVELELQRLDSFLGARERFIRRAIDSGVKLELKLPEGKLLAAVTAMDGSRVQLASNRLKLTELDLEQVPALELASQMRESKFQDPPHWIKAYPFALANATSGKTRLFVDSDESRRLQADVTQDYPERLARGRALLELDRLAVASATIDARNAADLLERAAHLFSRLPYEPAYASRRSALQALAWRTMAIRFDAVGLNGVLAGKVRNEANDNISIVYDFLEAREREDFIDLDPHYALQLWSRDDLPRLASRFKVQNGALEVMGLACCRHVLPLEARVVEYVVSVHEPNTNDGLLFLVGIHDDGYGSMVSSMNLGSLLLLDRATGEAAAHGGKGASVNLGMKYTIRLTNEGGVLRCDVDGRKVAELAAGARPSGFTVLSNGMGNRLSIDTLRITGKPTAAGQAELRARWIQTELARRGFGELK